MDGWLKALVACACGVIIAGGGWFATSAALDWRAARYADQQRFAAQQRVECAALANEAEWRREGGNPRTLDSNVLLTAKLGDCQRR
jgi:hypothetical protein